MTLKVYNSLTKQKEEFVPVIPGKVSMYVCGVTPYNHPHIGNARPFITWDVIKRYFRHLGYEVLHVQNFTIVDCKCFIIILLLPKSKHLGHFLPGLPANIDPLDRYTVIHI